MKALVYATKTGPQLIASLPGDPAEQPVQYSEGLTGSYAEKALAAKGPCISWDDYAMTLQMSLPYFGWWDVVDIPDGMGLRDGLIWVKVHTGLFG